MPTLDLETITLIDLIALLLLLFYNGDCKHVNYLEVLTLLRNNVLLRTAHALVSQDMVPHLIFLNRLLRIKKV